jgi:hypothetical protein
MIFLMNNNNLLEDETNPSYAKSIQEKQLLC